MPKQMTGQSPSVSPLAEPARLLPLVALSDAHLGVPYSLLHTSAGREGLFTSLRQELGGSRQLGCLLLLGDIPELSLVEDATAFARTREFLHDFLTCFEVEHLLYLPGNHDFRFWHRVVQEVSPTSYAWTGALNVRGETFCSPLPAANYGGFVGNMLEPADAARVRHIGLAYPDLFVSFEAAGRPSRPVLFQHGHLIKDIFVSPRWSDRLRRAGLLRLARRKFGRVNGVDNPWRAQTLPELQERMQPFLDSMFYARNEEGLPHIEALSHLIYLHQPQKRKLKDPNGVFPLPFVRRKYLRPLLHYLNCGGYLEAAREGSLSVVFGDSHDGGYREGVPAAYLDHDRPVELDLYNTAAWLVNGRKVVPRSSYFLLDEKLEGRLVRVSYPPDFVAETRRQGLSWTWQRQKKETESTSPSPPTPVS
jgi:hypothetical protein